MLLVPQTAAANWRVLCALLACYFPLVPCLDTVYMYVVVSFIFFLFFPARESFFSSAYHNPCGGGARQSVSSFFFQFFLFSFDLSSFCFCFSFVSFLFFISQIVYDMPVVSSTHTYMVTRHCIAHCCCCAYCIGGNVVSLCVSFSSNRSFYPSTSSTTSVGTDSSIREEIITIINISSVVTKLRHRDTTSPRQTYLVVSSKHSSSGHCNAMSPHNLYLFQG